MAAAIPIVAAVIGGAASLYGAKKNANAIKDANAANVAAQSEATALEYQRWRESQGIGADGNPINYKMPRWLMARTGLGGPRRLVPRSELSSVKPYQITGTVTDAVGREASSFAPAAAPMEPGRTDMADFG